MDLGLRNKVAAVAAASQGLGRAVAEEFVREGAKVSICARRADVLRGTEDDIRRSAHGDVHGVVADVAKGSDATKCIDESARHFGSLDILVLNAGGTPTGALESVSD